jgi:uncharacterized protein DUF6962
MIPTGEVVTMVTDYLLAATAFGAAMWLWKSAAGVPGRWWAVAFVATGVAAVLGGTSHGYAPVIDKQTHGLVWRFTYVTVGIANFCILYGAALAAVPRRFFRAAVAVLLARMLAVAAALIVVAQFRFVLYDYAITLVGLLALAAALGAQRQPGARWIVAGVAASTIGAVVQLTRIGQGRVFNHNDLFHVVQAIGIALYARGGRELGTRPAR